MKPWQERPVEVGNLLNPAFCAILLQQTTAGYEKQGGQGLDPSLLFLALPLGLHPTTRGDLPSTVATKLSVWIEQHQELKVGFAARCRGLVPYVKEALVFATSHGLLAVAKDGSIVTGPKKPKMKDVTPEVAAILAASFFLGRWFRDAGPPSQVFQVWGVMP